VAKNIVLLLHG